MGLITESKILGFRNTTRYYQKFINESLSEFKLESKYNKTTIFLSHKHGERDRLDAAISFLKKFNVEIYVDWLDDGMKIQPKLR